MSEVSYEALLIDISNCVLADFKLHNCSSVSDLKKNISDGNNYLISFGIGEIIPEYLLNKFKLAINIHGASPEYPGRDPHHYAIYDGVSEYGAVAHFMEKSVDSGAIIDLEMFKVNHHVNSKQLLKMACDCGMQLLKRVTRKILNSEELIPTDLKWGDRKTKRQDLSGFCKVLLTDTVDELQRKYKAFQEDIEYKNLYIDLHGFRFRFEKVITDLEDKQQSA